MFETDFPRLVRIEELLASRDHVALESFTLQQLPHQLLSESALNAARLLRQNATVMFLASLAVENLPKPLRFQTWLAIYQSITQGRETPEFQALPLRQPLRVIASAVIGRREVDLAALRKCHGGMDDWFHAAELAVDQLRFDVLEQIVAQLVRQKINAQDWLRLTKVLFNRQPFVPKGLDTDQLGRCYGRIRSHLTARLPAVDKVRSRLAMFATDCHFHAGNYPAAIEAAQLATTVEDRIHAAFDIARSHCFSGDLDQSLVWLDRLVALMCEHGPIHSSRPAKSATSPNDPEPDKEARNAFDPQQASKALLDLQNALAPINKQAFLVSGTLLGFHREGQLLAHDKDIDVGIIGWQDQYEVANALLQSGHFGLDSRRLRGSKTYHIPVRHIETRVSIDIFIYHEEDGKLVTGVESYFGYLQKFAFTPFGLEKVGFLGIDFYVPGDIEKNLAENFGHWRQSDPDYISHLQSPSTVDVGGKVFQIVGRIRALEAIRGAKFEKLSRVIQILQQHQGRPGGVSAQTLDLLKAAYDKRPVAEVM